MENIDEGAHDLLSFRYVKTASSTYSPQIMFINKYFDNSVTDTNGKIRFSLFDPVNQLTGGGYNLRGFEQTGSQLTLSCFKWVRLNSYDVLVFGGKLYVDAWG